MLENVKKYTVWDMVKISFETLKMKPWKFWEAEAIVSI